jgi:hypothetical protein
VTSKNSTKVNIVIKTIITTMTTWSVQACGWNSLVDYFNVKVRDIWEGDVTTRTEIETEMENIRSQTFGDTRERVTLRRVRCV